MNMKKVVSEVFGTVVFLTILIKAEKSRGMMTPLVVGFGLAAAMYMFGSGDYNPATSFLRVFQGSKVDSDFFLKLLCHVAGAFLAKELSGL